MNESRNPPSNLSPNRVLIPLGIGTAISLLGDSTLYTVLPKPEIAAEAGVTLAMVGLLLGANRVIRLITNSVAGGFYDRLPRRGMLIGSLALGVISTLIFALARGFWPLLTGRILWGAAWSGLWIGGNTIVLDISDDHNRGRLSARYQMWFFIGVGGSALMGGLFTDVFGYRNGLLISTGLIAIALLMWTFCLPETRNTRTISDRSDHPSSDDSFPWQVALTAAVPIFTVRFVFAGVMASTTILWLSEFLGERVTVMSIVIPIATLTGILVAIRTLTSIVGAPLTGFLSDRIGRRWVVIAGILLAGAVGTWMMGSSSLILAISGALIAAVTGGGIQSLAPAIAGDQGSGIYHGRILGVIYTFGDIGSALGPPLALSLIAVIPISRIYQLCAGLFLLVACFATWRSVSEPRLGSGQPV